MRHNVRGRKLGRTTAHRIALFRNQLAALVAKEKIVTTLHKAKELRPIAERVITRGRKDSVASRRWVRRWLDDRELVKKLFDDIAPRFMERPGGYLRIVKLGPRIGDGAEMAVIELVGGADEETSGKKGSHKSKSSAKKRAAKTRRGGKKAAPAEAAEEAEAGAEAEATPKPKAKKAAAKKAAAKKSAAKKPAAKKAAAKEASGAKKPKAGKAAKAEKVEKAEKPAAKKSSRSSKSKKESD